MKPEVLGILLLPLVVPVLVALGGFAYLLDVGVISWRV